MQKSRVKIALILAGFLSLQCHSNTENSSQTFTTPPEPQTNLAEATGTTESTNSETIDTETSEEEEQDASEEYEYPTPYPTSTPFTTTTPYATATPLVIPRPTPIHANRPAAKPTFLGNFWVTFYYVTDAKDFPRQEDDEILSPTGKIIARVNSKFKKALDIEGTGRLLDGRIINFSKYLRGESRYVVIQSKYGVGVANCPLRPYRTLAVDPDIIPLGTKVYIPELDGVLLPDGSQHDGMFLALDRGSRIENHHIDIFAGVGSRSMRVFGAAGLQSFEKVKLYKMGRIPISQCPR